MPHCNSRRLTFHEQATTSVDIFDDAGTPRHRTWEDSFGGLFMSGILQPADPRPSADSESQTEGGSQTECEDGKDKMTNSQIHNFPVK